MRYYFFRSEAGIGRLTQGTDRDALGRQYIDSLEDHPNDWHSPIREVDDEEDIRESPITIVFVDGADHYRYPDGHMELV